MCDFILANGSVLHESDFASLDGQGGWKRFPYKRDVVAVDLNRRRIDAQTFMIPDNQFKGFAIHFVETVFQSKQLPHVVREVMLVQRNLKVFVCSFNIKNMKWSDYVDSLKNPERPHLIGYDLSQHGM